MPTYIMYRTIIVVVKHALAHNTVAPLLQERSSSKTLPFLISLETMEIASDGGCVCRDLRSLKLRIIDQVSIAVAVRQSLKPYSEARQQLYGEDVERRLLVHQALLSRQRRQQLIFPIH